MTEEEKWAVFHDYRRLAEQGIVPFLKCSCGASFVMRLSPKDTLVLWCVACDTITTPGENMLSRVKGTVSEWIL